MDSTLYDIVIVGAGPAGVVCYEKIKTASLSKVLLIDSESDYCNSVKNYGVFYKNLNSLPIEEYDKLLSGNKKGVDIYNYFHKKFADEINVTEFSVISIEIKDGIFYLKNNAGKALMTKKVMLATGVKRKTLNVLDFCNITLLDKNKIKELADKNNGAIIYIGSGDNSALKSIRMCKLYESDADKFNRGRVSIIARPLFWENINKCFHDDLRHYENIGILNIFYTEEEIKRFEYTPAGFVRKIIFERSVFKVDPFEGGLVGVYTGFESNIPILTNCSEKDLILIGDVQSMSSQAVMSLTNAVDSAENAARDILTNRLL